MSEAIQFQSSTSQFTDSLLGLMVRMRVPAGKILSVPAVTLEQKGIKTQSPVEEREVDLTALPAFPPSLGERMYAIAETLVLVIEQTFGRSAHRIVKNTQLISFHSRRYTKYMLAWVKYLAVLFLMYATDNRRKGALSKLTGVLLGAFAGALAGSWASEIVTHAIPGAAGDFLGFAFGATLILALVEAGKALGTAISARTGRSKKDFASESV